MSLLTELVRLIVGGGVAVANMSLLTDAANMSLLTELVRRLYKPRQGRYICSISFTAPEHKPRRGEISYQPGISNPLQNLCVLCALCEKLSSLIPQKFPNPASVL